jgi:hypothetical protein
MESKETAMVATATADNKESRKLRIMFGYIEN